MLTRILASAAMAWALACAGLAQESNFGVTLPVTASAGVMDSGRLQLANPNASRAAFGLRVMLYPTVKLGKHWFAYGAVQVRRLPYFYYDAFLPDRGWRTDVIQGYAGYTVQSGRSTLVIKAGQISFGFRIVPALRYDERG